MELLDGGTFKNWQEGPISFAPNYKYHLDSDVYYGRPNDSGKKIKKKRCPAWCNRIIWYGKGLRQEQYTRGESKLSDHRPVMAIFTADVRVSFSLEQIKRQLEKCCMDDIDFGMKRTRRSSRIGGSRIWDGVTRWRRLASFLIREGLANEFWYCVAFGISLIGCCWFSCWSANPQHQDWVCKLMKIRFLSCDLFQIQLHMRCSMKCLSVRWGSNRGVWPRDNHDWNLQAQAIDNILKED